MDLRPTRQRMVNTLVAARISFPESATMSQLRGLYEAINTNEIRVSNTDLSENDSGVISSDAVNSSAAVTSDSISSGAITSAGITSAASSEIITIATSSNMFPSVTTFPVLSTISVDSIERPLIAFDSSGVVSATSNVTSRSNIQTTFVSSNMSNGGTTFSNSQQIYSSANLQYTSSQESQELENQIKILRMRCEMINLQKQLLELEGNVNKGCKIDYEELDKMVPKFSGNDNQDICKWFSQFEGYALNFTDQKRLMCLKWLLQGTAREYMEISSSLQYNDLKVSLLMIFKRTITLEEVYRKLRSRILKPSESCINYIISMQTIASQADIGGQELVDIIIDGMQDNSNNVSLLYGLTTVNELIQCIDRYEKRRIKNNPDAEIKKMNPRRDVRCFNCSQFGHVKSACPKPIRPAGSCFICHQMGHFHKDCPKRQRVAASVFQETVDVNDIVDHMQMIERGDTLPQHVCITCAKNTISACLFKKKCEDADNFFRQQLLIRKIESKSNQQDIEPSDDVTNSQNHTDLHKSDDEEHDISEHSYKHHLHSHRHINGDHKEEHREDTDENQEHIDDNDAAAAAVEEEDDGEIKSVNGQKPAFGFNSKRLMHEYMQQHLNKFNDIQANGGSDDDGGDATGSDTEQDDDEPLPLIPEIGLLTPSEEGGAGANASGEGVLGNTTTNGATVGMKQMRGYQCPHCFQVFEMKQVLKAHMQAFHGTSGPVYECTNCKKTYFYKRFLEKHVRSGRCVKKRRNQTRPMQCTDCNTLFPTGHHLGWHKRTGCPSKNTNNNSSKNSHPDDTATESDSEMDDGDYTHHHPPHNHLIILN